MSLSNLASQLAGLNSSGSGNKNVGSILPSSTRHDDAVGRGLHHSVQIGHTISHGTDPRFKPSLLYEDTRAASDVPLSTLWENCKAALEEMSDLYPPLQAYVGVCQDVLLQQRRTTTKGSDSKATTTTSLTHLLTILSTLIPHDNVNCLHVLEYLVRRYNIHITAADTLLMILLPHCEAHPQLFHRALQLVNIAGSQQHTWIWLRPYARTDRNRQATADEIIPAPPRHVVVKHTISNTALLQQVCSMTQNVARLLVTTNTNTTKPHRGIRQILSWSATLMVQGLHYLQTVEVSLANKESVLRVLLPICTSACSSSSSSSATSSSQCMDWTMWGQLVASCLSETMELAPPVKQCLCEAILKGVSNQVTALGQQQPTEDNDEEEQALILAVGDALVAVLSVCSPSHHNTNDAAAATTTPCCWDATIEIWKDCVAIPYPSALQKIWKLGDKVLAMALHQMYHDREIDIAGLITSLLIWSVLFPTKNTPAHHQLLTKVLMKDRVMWENEHLTKAFAEWLVWTYVSTIQDDKNKNRDHHQNNKQPETKLAMYQQLLSSLRQLDATACEEGMANAMMSLEDDEEEYNKNDQALHKKRLAALLQGVLPAPQKPSSNEENKSTTTTDSWLPPRIALEHADAALRLQAIRRLLKEFRSNSNKKEKQVKNDDDDGDEDDEHNVVMTDAHNDDNENLESLQEGLSRRMASDDDPRVVFAAASALREILEFYNLGKGTDLHLPNVLAASYRWSSFSSSKKKRKKGKKKDKTNRNPPKLTTEESIIVGCLHILGMVEEHTVPVVEALAAHLEHSNEEIVTTAASSLVKMMGSESSKETNDVDQAKELLVLGQGGTLRVNLLADSVTTKESDTSGSTETALRRRSQWVLLGAMKDWLSKSNTDEENLSGSISQSIVESCLAVLSSPTEKDWRKNPQRVESFKEAWGVAMRYVVIETVPSVLLSLVSEAKEKVYQSLCKGLIQTLVSSVKDGNGEDVSVYSVLLETALLDTIPVVGVTRLLRLAQDCLNKGNGRDTIASSCVIPALALLEHADESVRLVSLELLTLWKETVSKQPKDAEYRSLESVCQEVSKKQSSATLGGISFLPSCLAAAVKKAGGTVVDDLLSLCLNAAVVCGSLRVKNTTAGEGSAWLPFGRNAGHVGAAVTVLRAMEHAGEDAFPLRQRWHGFGATILKSLLGTKKNGASNIPPALMLLCDATVGMIKGISVGDSRSLDTVVISMGPSSTGRRQRSYSIGNAEGVTYVEQYPEEMVAAIVNILKASDMEQNQVGQVLCRSLATNVLGRETWGSAVFAKFSSDQKRTISAELLRLLADSPLQISSFLSLPLDASDIAFLRKVFSEKSNELAAVSILADFIRSNSKRLASSSGTALLVKTLFTALATFSSPARYNDEAEFVRQAILSALVDLMSQNQTENNNLQIREKDVSGFVDILLSLNSNDMGANNNLRPLVSQRAKATALTVLTKLCSSFPKPVVASLIPALEAHIEATERVEAEENMGEHSHNTFGSIIPVFWKYSSHVGLSFSHLLSACVESIRLISSQKKRAGIYCSLIRAISSCSLSGLDESAMGSVIASYFAGEVHASDSDFKQNLQDSTEFALQVMYESSGFAQVSSTLLMLHYADSLLLVLNGDGDYDGSEAPQSSISRSDADSSLPKTNDLIQMALTGTPASINTSTEDKRRVAVIKDLVQALLLTSNDLMLMESVRKCIRRSDRSHTTLCLRLWRDLLILQSTAAGTASTLDDDTDFAETITRVSGESLEQVQYLMPLPVFFASASSLIKDGDTDDLRAGAMRLVADRVPEVRPGTPEASLFLEMASSLVSFLKVPKKGEDNGAFILQQSALVAIEHIARALHEGPTREKASKNQDRTFLSALEGCADLFVQICGPGKKMKVEVGNLDDSARRLLCSAALCTATLVRATAPKCLALLPKFMHQIVASLCSVNSLVLSTDCSKLEILSDARTTQVCLLRALESVAESVPQFIFPYLKHLLDHSALPSEALRGADVDQSVRLAAEGLEKSLSSHVPVRVLLPAVSAAFASLKRPTEFEVLIRVLKQSIDASSSEELIGHLGALLNAVTSTYDFECEFGVRVALVDAANEAVLGLVMKLSEHHLRRLYTKLRDWRGDLEAENANRFAMRRYAFWKASAVLSSELRAIFLPCLSSVLGDALDELNLVASNFCSKKSEKTGDGKKKRRLDDARSTLSANSMRSILPLLSCLELSLRADSQAGGNWVRADDGKRYRSLLEPLGLLLQSKVPPDFPSAEQGNSFQLFVQGGADAMTGSVVGCLTALASAGGNEQLWKPLNYAVLDACGNSSRSEVRKAGLACLLSLMQSLGEEYMVLLPECLPVLAELLEDNDEEVAGLAQDCISFGEDLLGESLEDSLR